jgi:hypothetical protein
LLYASLGPKNVNFAPESSLEVLTTACEQHNINKFDFMVAIGAAMTI